MCFFKSLRIVRDVSPFCFTGRHCRKWIKKEKHVVSCFGMLNFDCKTPTGQACGTMLQYTTCTCIN